MKVTVSDKNSYTKVLDVEAEESKINEQFNDLLKKHKKSIKLPGFRPGKIPNDIIINRFGKELRDEAIESVVSSTLQEAFKNEELTPISRPKIIEIDSKKGNPLVFKAEVEIEPEIEIKKYKDLGIKPDIKKTSKKDIDEAISAIRDQFAALKTAERPLKKGDYALLHYKKVIIDGQNKDDFKDPQYPVLIGDGPLKDLQLELIGLKAGEEKSIKYTFPKNFSEKEVADKDAEFEILVKEIKEKELPELDDKFVKNIFPDVNNVDEFRKKVEKELSERSKNQALKKAHDDALQKIIKENPFEVPTSRLNQYLDYAYENFKKQYGDKANVTKEEFDEKNKEAALNELKKYRILDYIAKKEDIKAHTKEVDEEIKKMAKANNRNYEEIKQNLKKNGGILNIRENLRDQKVLNFIIDYKNEDNE